MREFVDCQRRPIRLDTVCGLQLLTYVVGQEPTTVGNHPGQCIARWFIERHRCLCDLAKIYRCLRCMRACAVSRSNSRTSLSNEPDFCRIYMRNVIPWANAFWSAVGE